MRSGTSPSLAVTGPALEEPPRSASTEMPVSPWESSVTSVSERTGVVVSTEMVATEFFGSFGSSDSAVTSPTRMPLNVTDAPGRRPPIGPWNMTL